MYSTVEGSLVRAPDLVTEGGGGEIGWGGRGWGNDCQQPEDPT